MKLVEIAPNRFRFLKSRIAPACSDLPRPFVISDEMPPTEHVDGRFYTSKAAYRAVTRAHGLTEVGTEKFKPKRRTTDDPQVKRLRKQAVHKAVEKFKAGHRAGGVRA